MDNVLIVLLILIDLLAFLGVIYIVWDALPDIFEYIEGERYRKSRTERQRYRYWRK